MEGRFLIELRSKINELEQQLYERSKHIDNINNDSDSQKSNFEEIINKLKNTIVNLEDNLEKEKTLNLELIEKIKNLSDTNLNANKALKIMNEIKEIVVQKGFLHEKEFEQLTKTY